MRGSSPWARGTHCLFRNKMRQVRFIPVGTGNTENGPTPFVTMAVHPRGHGEHVVDQNHSGTNNGSSPWARGTLINAEETLKHARFIPVGTGNTHLRYQTFRLEPVHPRGHGEHTTNLRRFTFRNGSSPWARGTPRFRQVVRRLQRFIPVGTGNTCRTGSAINGGTVHPRGHGEHFWKDG